MTVLFIRIDTGDLLNIEDIAPMGPYELGRVQHLLEIIHRLVLQEGSIVRMDLHVIVRCFEVVDVFYGDDLDLPTRLDDDTLLL